MNNKKNFLETFPVSSGGDAIKAIKINVLHSFRCGKRKYVRHTYQDFSFNYISVSVIFKAIFKLKKIFSVIFHLHIT